MKQERRMSAEYSGTPTAIFISSIGTEQVRRLSVLLPVIKVDTDNTLLRKETNLNVTQSIIRTQEGKHPKMNSEVSARCRSSIRTINVPASNKENQPIWKENIFRRRTSVYHKRQPHLYKSYKHYR